MLDNVDVTELAGGDMVDKMNDAMREIAANILDPNTKPEAAREIICKVTFVPNAHRDAAAIKIDVSTKLAKHRRPAESMLFFSQARDGSIVISQRDSRQEDLFAGVEVTVNGKAAEQAGE
jgi:hypothetical protein